MELISRDESIEKCLTRFFTGIPCDYGHVCERFTCNGHCVSCKKRYQSSNQENGDSEVIKEIEDKIEE